MCGRVCPLPNLIEGGAQERGRRAGTENLPAIHGMTLALETALDGLERTAPHVRALRDRLIAGALANRTQPRQRRYGQASGRQRERLLRGRGGRSAAPAPRLGGDRGLLRLGLHLRLARPVSHVLLALGLPHEIAHGSLRLSLSESSTEAEVDYMY